METDKSKEYSRQAYKAAKQVMEETNKRHPEQMAKLNEAKGEEYDNTVEQIVDEELENLAGRFEK